MKLLGAVSLSYETLLGLSLVLSSIYYVSVLNRQRSLTRQEHAAGCQPVRYDVPGHYIGLKALRARLTARRAGLLPRRLAESMDAAGVHAHTLKQRFLMSTFIMTRDPKNVKTVLSTKASDYELGPIRAVLAAKGLGKNVFTHEGQAWKDSHSLVRPQFHFSQITDTDLFEKHVQESFRWLHTGNDGWSSKVDLNPLFSCLALDATSEFLFGYSIHSQNHVARSVLPKVENLAMPDTDRFGDALDRASDWISTLSPLGR
ncbi:MAG: hypothetical protein Q9181_006749 [Wetmoreana brouardii]